MFLGDVMGRAGRQAIFDTLPWLRAEWRLDFVTVNAENATGGAGVSPTHAAALFDAGVDCITLGDHAFDQRDMLRFIDIEPRIVRPLNYAKAGPGVGARVFTIGRGAQILVAQVLGQVFMKRPFEDPFSTIDGVLNRYPLGGQVAAILIDVHAEATSEKMAMGHFCDGRASLVVGTHTHVPTADTMILPRGTAYHTDAGMCGDYHSVIGMETREPLHRFITGMPNGRFTPATGAATLCGIFVETDDKTGKAVFATPVRMGGILGPTGDAPQIPQNPNV